MTFLINHITCLNNKLWMNKILLQICWELSFPIYCMTIYKTKFCSKQSYALFKLGEIPSNHNKRKPCP